MLFSATNKRPTLYLTQYLTLYLTLYLTQYLTRSAGGVCGCQVAETPPLWLRLQKTVRLSLGSELAPFCCFI